MQIQGCSYIVVYVDQFNVQIPTKKLKRKRVKYSGEMTSLSDVLPLFQLIAYKINALPKCLSSVVWSHLRITLLIYIIFYHRGHIMTWLGILLQEVWSFLQPVY